MRFIRDIISERRGDKATPPPITPAEDDALRSARPRPEMNLAVSAADLAREAGMDAAEAPRDSASEQPASGLGTLTLGAAADADGMAEKPHDALAEAGSEDMQAEAGETALAAEDVAPEDRAPAKPAESAAAESAYESPLARLRALRDAVATSESGAKRFDEADAEAPAAVAEDAVQDAADDFEAAPASDAVPSHDDFMAAAEPEPADPEPASEAAPAQDPEPVAEAAPAADPEPVDLEPVAPAMSAADPAPAAQERAADDLAEMPFVTVGDSVGNGADAQTDAGAASDDIHVPPPAAGRGSAGSGRVKTRLLGFNPAGLGVSDPFEKAAAAPTRDFPVAWLVVVSGPGRGASFSLHDGVSRIGRGADQSVPLAFGDTAISRENHASIAYDPEENSFYIGQSGKANIVRLNSKPLLSTEQLKSGDQIRLGETTLRFVALCNEDFRWSDGA